METKAELARVKKDEFLKARAALADFETLQRIGNEYIAAMKEWHAERFPGKKFKAPSIGYLIRAL